MTAVYLPDGNRKTLPEGADLQEAEDPEKIRQRPASERETMVGMGDMEKIRDQALVFSRQERAYLIDAMVVFMNTVENTWERDRYSELRGLLQDLMRTQGDRPEHRLLGKQVTVTLGKKGVNPDGTAYGEDAIISGQFLGVGEGGNFEILEDDGMIYHCWPALQIEPRSRDDLLRADKAAALDDDIEGGHEENGSDGEFPGAGFAEIPGAGSSGLRG
jgi:hypothetical protein